MATMRLEATPTHVEEFAACLGDYKQVVEELREVERRMTCAVESMRSEGASRERLLMANGILSGIRETLRRSLA